jgi:hypothetical protein
MARIPFDPNLILPVGTQVVLRREIKGRAGSILARQGAVGVILRAPPDNFHSYRVGLPDGVEVAVRRSAFTIRRRQQADELRAAAEGEFNLAEHVVYRCVIGSRAYGLADDESDIDRRGIYLPPADLHWSLYGVPEQIENDDTQECYWELQKFLVLALKANPNVLECLYTPLVEFSTPLADELLGMRSIFLSRMIYQTYNGYVLSQFKKLEQDLRTTGTLKWKHAMHLIRLLLAGVTGLREEVIPVQVGQQRARLLAIRRGELPWHELNHWRLDLHRAFDEAFAQTKLPDRPNYERANAFLIKARRSRT